MNTTTTTGEDFGRLVREEEIRRSLRKTPEARLASLTAALQEAEHHGLFPRRDRKAHEEQLKQWLSQHESSRH